MKIAMAVSRNIECDLLEWTEFQSSCKTRDSVTRCRRDVRPSIAFDLRRYGGKRGAVRESNQLKLDSEQPGESVECWMGSAVRLNACTGELTIVER